MEAGAQTTRADLSLVGSSDLAVPGTEGGPLRPRGNNDDVAIVGSTAFVGGGSAFHGVRATPGRICTDWGGVKNVDLSNPSSPVLRAPIRIDDPAGIASPAGNPRQIESGTPANGGIGRRFHNTAQAAVALDAISVDIPGGFKGDLLAVSVARCEPSFFAGGRYEFYNVTNPANPIKVGMFESPGTPGTFEDIRIFQRGSQVLAIGTIAFGASQGPGGEFRYLDVTPALSGGTVNQLGEFPNVKPVGQVSNNGCKTFYGGRGVAPTPDGQNALLTFYDGLIEYGARRAAVLNLSLGSLPSGFGSPPPFFGYPATDRTVEGNAAAVEPFTGPAGNLLAMVSEDDTDPSLTDLTINAPSGPSTHRVCESHMSNRLYQLPGQ